MRERAQEQERMNTLAAEALFREYYTRLCHFAYQFSGNREEAKDIAQEAFVNYLAQQENVSDHPIAIRNFLYSSIRNACLNAQRHEKVVKKFAAQKATEPVAEAGVIQAIIKSEVLGAIHQALQSLPEECQRIIRMGYIDGLKNKKIAELLDISINTVKTQKKRGLQLLRLRLPPELYTFFL